MDAEPALNAYLALEANSVVQDKPSVEKQTSDKSALNPVLDDPAFNHQAVDNATLKTQVIQAKSKLTDEQFEQLCDAVRSGKRGAQPSQILKKSRNTVDWCLRLIDKQGLIRGKRMLVEGKYNTYSDEQLQGIALLKFQKGLSAEELEVTFGTCRGSITRRCAALSSYYAAKVTFMMDLPDTRISYLHLLRSQLPEQLLFAFERGILSDFAESQHNALMYRLYHTNLIPAVKEKLTQLTDDLSIPGLKSYLKELADTPVDKLVEPAAPNEQVKPNAIKKVVYVPVPQTYPSSSWWFGNARTPVTYYYAARPKLNSAERAEKQAQRAIKTALRTFMRQPLATCTTATPAQATPSQATLSQTTSAQATLAQATLAQSPLSQDNLAKAALTSAAYSADTPRPGLGATHAYTGVANAYTKATIEASTTKAGVADPDVTVPDGATYGATHGANYSAGAEASRTSHAASVVFADDTIIPGVSFETKVQNDKDDDKVKLFDLPKSSRNDMIEELLGPAHPLIPASAYDAGHARGPVPFVDPQSPGFKNYPKSVQHKILNRLKDEKLVRRTACNLLRRLSDEDLTMQKGVWLKYQILPELEQRFPTLKPTFIQNCLNISGRMKKYYDAHPVRDKYEKVLPLIVTCFNESHGTFGKRRMCQALRRRYGIYLSIITVKKLMDRLGLVSAKHRA